VRIPRKLHLMTVFSIPGDLIVSGGNIFSASWVGTHGNVVDAANTITCDGEVEAAGDQRHNVTVWVSRVL
jgi:hypothetical protein